MIYLRIWEIMLIFAISNKRKELNMKREDFIEYLYQNISEDSILYAHCNMCAERIPLNRADDKLCNRIIDLGKDFVEIHELNDDWIEEVVGTIEDVFEELVEYVFEAI